MSGVFWPRAYTIMGGPAPVAREPGQPANVCACASLPAKPKARKRRGKKARVS